MSNWNQSAKQKSKDFDHELFWELKKMQVNVKL